MLSNLSREARAEKKARRIAKAKLERVSSHEQNREGCDGEEEEEEEESEKEEKVGEADEEEDKKTNNRSRDMYRSMDGSALMAIGAPYTLCRSV
jgi:hypothetical protein